MDRSERNHPEVRPVTTRAPDRTDVNDRRRERKSTWT